MRRNFSDPKHGIGSEPRSELRPEWVGKLPCDIWDDFGDFAQAFLGLTPHPDTGRYGYWTSLAWEWNSWSVGGRWSDWLILKEAHTQQRTVAARMGDIDWAAMRAAPGRTSHANAFIRDYGWYDSRQAKEAGEDWSVKFEGLIQDAPDDELVTVVDYHL
jgi:hypothetical protein